MDGRQYAAFISYRHAELDTAVAEHLQRMLEHYGVPREQRRDGNKHLGLVFRDRDELPLSSDLTQDIYDALDNSEFLIVVCSPETPKSDWVAREIEYFISKHGYRRVLTVLAAGTPAESIPRQVTRIPQEDGTVREVEPLCAYLVAPDQRQVMRNLKKEKLRLIAAMLQCPYDTMVQREKRYRQRRISMALGAAALVVLCFAAVMVRNYLQVQELNRQIEAQLIETQLSEAKALAAVSGQQLAEGDRAGALESALMALPSEREDRPLVNEAESALMDALFAYEDTQMRMVARAEHAANIYDMALSADGAYAATIYENGQVNGIDARLGTILWSAQAFFVEYSAPGALNLFVRYFAFAGSDSLLCVSLNEAVAFSAADGAERFRIDFAARDAVKACLSGDGSKLAVLLREAVNVNEEKYELVTYDMASGQEIGRTGTLQLSGWVNTSLRSTMGYNKQQSEGGAAIFFSEDGSRLHAVLASTRPEESCTVLTVDPASGEVLASHTFDWPTAGIGGLTAAGLDNGGMVIHWHQWIRLEDGQNARAHSLVRLSAEQEVVYEQIQSHIHGFAPGPVPDEAVNLVITQSRVFCAGATYMMAFDLEDGSLVFEGESDSEFLLAMAVPGEELVALVEADGTVSCVTPEGSMEETGLHGLVGSGFALLAAKAGQEGFCAVPQDARDTVVFFAPCGDGHAQTVFAFLDDDLEDSWYAMTSPYLYFFPSGDRLLVHEMIVMPPEAAEPGDEAPSTWYNNIFTTYDAETLEMLDRFTVKDSWGEYEYMIADYYLDGFSADESKLYFSNRYVLDLEAHGIYKLEAGWNLELSYPMAVMPLSHQQPGESNLIVNFYGDTLTWLEDGTEHTSRSPWTPDDYGVRYHPIYVGGSGMVAIPAYRRDENAVAMLLDYYMLYSIRDDRWTRLDNQCSADIHLEPALCVGDTHPWLAIADVDGVLRIYDQESDSVIREFPLNLFPYNIEDMLFALDDSVLLIQAAANTLLAVDTQSGERLGRYHLEGTWPMLNYWVDESRGMLYLAGVTQEMTGLCIDMSDWSVRFTVPRMLGYLAGSNSVLRRDESSRLLLRYPVYDTRELVEWGREILSGK